MPRTAPGWVTVLVLTVALVLQVTVLSRLPLPGATPDLVLLVLVAVALRGGPDLGLAAGFVAGLALDIVPPADHAIGRWAFVLCLVGYVCGFLADEGDRSAVLPIIVAGAASAASVLGFAALGVLIDDPRVSWDVVLGVLPTAVAYDVVLSPFVIYAVFRLFRGIERDQVLVPRGGSRV